MVFNFMVLKTLGLLWRTTFDRLLSKFNTFTILTKRKGETGMQL